MKRKRLYQLNYDATDQPIYIEDAGHLLKIGGILFQGMSSTILMLSPTADDTGISAAELDDGGVIMIQPSLEEWCEIIRRTDDPLIFEQDDTGTIKSIHRKQEYAISGAIQQTIWARDDFRCLYCGNKMGVVQLTIDHFVPLELGGKNDGNNYVSCCRQCNKRKGNQAPKDYCRKNDLDYEGLALYLSGKAPLLFVGHL